MDREAPFVHLVARARILPTALVTDEVAVWLWPRLRDAFPFSFGAVLMPNHLHLVASVASDPERQAVAARSSLARVVGGLARSGGARGGIRFEPVPEARVQAEPSKLLRNTRYAALNPNRAGLVDDPLEWAWSTHRDVMGAVNDPWVTPARLAAAVGRDPGSFRKWWHDYVTRDDTVSRHAATLPRSASPTRFASVPLESVARGVVHATRACTADIRRRGPVRETFLAAAAQVGWTQTRLLADYCEMSQRAVQEALARPPPDLAAVLLCLGDPRLH